MKIFGGRNIILEKSDEKGMLNVKKTKNYLDQSLNAACKIILSDTDRFGSGFFCQIPHLKIGNCILLALITCYHVLENDLNEKYIEIIINEEHKFILLEHRNIWANKELDFVCIEIKENQDEIHTFYNLDEKIFEKNYLDEKVLIFGINQNDKELGVSNGIIKKINEESFFAYTCNTTPGCSGGCIVRQNNNCVIGIHQGAIAKEKKLKLNQGIYLRDVIESIQKDDNKLIVKNKILEDEGYVLNIIPELQNTQTLLNKLYIVIMPKLSVIFIKESNYINGKTSKQLREFNTDSYYNEKLTEFNKLFNDIYEEDLYQFQNYSGADIHDVKEKLASSFIESIRNIVQNKYKDSFIYPKNVKELLKEQNISNLIKGNEYELYYNLLKYKVVALDNEKVTLPGLTVWKHEIHDEENGSDKNIIKKKTNINAYFDPETMEIKLSDNSIHYRKESHVGSLRIDIKGTIRRVYRGHFKKLIKAHRNDYIDDFYNKMFINLPENFEFDILEGNNLVFDKDSYCKLVISVDYNQTLKVINVGQSGNTFINKISVKPFMNFE